MADVTTPDRVADLTDAEAAAVRALGLAVYAPDQFADWPRRAVEWSAAKWCVRTACIRRHGGARRWP